MLRKTTSISAATANKFANNAEVISAKSEHAKKHVLEMIAVRNNLAPTKCGKNGMAAIKYSENDKGKRTNLLRPSRRSCIQKPEFS